MWKSYDRFYSQTLKSEAGFLFALKNVNKVPSVNKICITCLSKTPIKTKGVLMTSSGLQLLVNKKAQLVTAQKSIITTKVRKGQPLGSKITINKSISWQFLHFLTFVLMPQLDLTKLFSLKEKSSDFKFYISTPTVFSRLTPFFNFFQFLPPIQVVVLMKNFPTKGKIFFWRLLKLPLTSLSKNR